MSAYMSEDELLGLIKALSSESKSSNEHAVVDQVEHQGQGTVQVESNKVLVTDPSDQKSYARIQALPPIKLYVNGQHVTDSVTVRATDHIAWEIDSTPMFIIDVSKDKMQASFKLNSLKRYDWQLKSQEPTASLKLEAFEDLDSVLEAVQLTHVMQQVQKMGICKNLKPSAIFQELQAPTYQPVLIAQGVQPAPSQDASIELYFNEQVETAYFEAGGMVDYRNHLRIPSVKKGDIIAKKIPLVEGTVGYDVFGEIVKPDPPKDVMIMAKDHVEINSKGEVYALKEGRPRISGQQIKFFDISTSYVISGDVDIRTGHIVFSGDVVVYGDVQDSMIIESLGNVYVSGNVYRSTITATGSIVVKGNCLGGQLYSGYFGVIFNRLYSGSKKLAGMLKDMLEAAKLLIGIIEAKGKSIRVGQVINMVIENKFKEIPTIVREIIGCIMNIQNINAKELDSLKERLELLLHPLRIVELQAFSQLYSIQHLIQDTFQSIERMQESLVQIEVSQCHLTTIKSNGDILIRRDGVVQSQLYSKGNIIFYGAEAVCRGSQLEAGDTICAMYVGGESGGQTLLKAGKKVTLKKITFGRIGVGRFWRDFIEPDEHLVLHTNGLELFVERDTMQK
ncbi:FapA family protein [Paenibacillus sp. YYML68]|uniref:FapA family protein n=1 Tax=Paenibacillus sp. YYML68 TaxID=2909250 RepID=UPI0024900C8D|nr:FapA family protein [Paenibacillus sp. YYML68]